MIQNNFKTAIRNLWRNRQFSIINTAGLALGIAVFLFIMEFVAFEWNANRYNKNFSSLYRVNLQYKDGHSDYYLPPGLAPSVKEKIPAIEKYVRVADGIAAGVVTYNAPVNDDSKVFRENDMVYADGDFLDVFSYPLVAGTTSLNEPNTLALSETISRKIFGTADAVGKVLTVSNQFGNTPYTIRAVYKTPENSDIKSAIILSFKTLENPANRDGNDWADPQGLQSGFTNTYLLLKTDAIAASVSKSITSFIHSVSPDTKDEQTILQPFSNLHLAPSFSYPYQTFGSLSLVTVFFAISLLILIIAWVNYINLSTAQALNRAKEVGVRKVLGASRTQLVFQYLAETFILTIAAFLLAIGLIHLIQPVFNEFTGKPLSLYVLNEGVFWLAGILMVIAGSCIAGGYVAFVISGFKPVSALRSKAQVTIKGLSLRKGLVVFQFTISIVLIMATVVLYKQLQYMQTEKLGMNLDQLLVIKGPTVSSEGQAEKNVSFKNSLSQLPFIKKQAASNNVPGIGYNFSTEEITKLNNPQKGDEKKPYSMFICDQNFFDTYGIGFVQGHTFSQEDAERSWNNVKKVIINEAAARQLGFDLQKNIIGQKINWGSPYEIIGVVKDYHHLSLREAIRPAIYLGSVSFSYFTIKTEAKDIPSKMATIKKIYAAAFPGNPFEYFFADEQFAKQYFSDRQLGNVFVAAACLAIFIACLGLFGLAAFSAKQRIKEIGIRKVLGAGVGDITSLLSKDFIKLVLIALVIAAPLAWWAMHKWLQDFAYRTTISWWIFLLVGVIALFIALVTVSSEAIRAALSNPVKSLRTE